MKYLSASALLLALLAAGCHSDSSSTATKETPAAAAEAPAPKGQAAILFFGDSITAGLGVEPDQAYPALIEERID